MEEVAKEIIKQSKEVLLETYKDVASPSMKSIGKTLSLIPRTIAIWLQGWEKYVVNKELVFEATVNAIKSKVDKLDEDKLVEPEPYVVIPAIQQLSYCYNSEELRELYENLLVSSMNIDTKECVHPAFVDIIKQLSPDEAKFLKRLSPTPIAMYPMADLMCRMPNIAGEHFWYENFTTEGLDSLDIKQNIGSYINNLSRLGIIELSPIDRFIADEGFYKSIENHPYLESLKPHNYERNGYKFYFRRRYFKVTQFGADFLETCISREDGKSFFRPELLRK